VAVAAVNSVKKSTVLHNNAGLAYIMLVACTMIPFDMKSSAILSRHILSSLAMFHSPPPRASYTLVAVERLKDWHHHVRLIPCGP
jgi:hypothetical protein